MKRWHRILVRLLVVAQLLIAAPLASAALSAVADRAEDPSCAEMMGMHSETADTGECPCCPDGGDSLSDCLATCTLSAVALPDTQPVPHRAARSLRVEAAPPVSLLVLSNPPLKPPPIR